MTPFNYDPNADKISDRYLFQGGVLDTVTGKASEEIQAAMSVHFQNIVLSLL